MSTARERDISEGNGDWGWLRYIGNQEEIAGNVSCIVVTRTRRTSICALVQHHRLATAGPMFSENSINRLIEKYRDSPIRMYLISPSSIPRHDIFTQELQ